MLKDLKAFILRGNVVDLAVGVVIGAAFGKIVTALVEKVMMPVVSLITPAGDWRAWAWLLDAKGEGAADDVKIAGGEVLGVTLDFVITAIVLFFVVKAIARFQARSEAPPATTRECPRCFETIAKKATRCKHCTAEIAAVA